MRNRLLVCTGLLGFLCLPPSVSAGPLRIDWLLQNDAATPGALSGFILGTDSLAPLTLSGTEGPTFGTTTGRVDHGSLGLYGLADGQVLIVSDVQFTDTLTLVSDTLAPGTLVDIAVRLALDYSLAASCIRDVARVSAILSLDTTDLRFSDDTCAGIGFNNTSTIMTVAIGDTIDLHAHLSITAGAGNCCELGFAEADALNTMRFFVDPLGSNFTYTSLTGRPYLSPAVAPVPEPGTLLLLSTGVAGALGARRRRRKAL